MFFVDSDPQMHDQSDNLVQNASTKIVTTRARSTSKNLNIYVLYVMSNKNVIVIVNTRQITNMRK